MTLCLKLVVARNCFWLVEQPVQSLLYRHHRFEFFTNRVVWDSCLRGIAFKASPGIRSPLLDAASRWNVSKAYDLLGEYLHDG